MIIINNDKNAVIKIIKKTVIKSKPKPNCKLQNKSVEITENGKKIVNPDPIYDGLSSVEITTIVPSKEPKLQSKSLTINKNGNTDVIPDPTYDGLSKISITTNVPTGGSGGTDWSVIGYTSEPQVVTNAINYSKYIYEKWDASQTDLMGKFSRDIDLVYMPLVDTSNATTMEKMFNKCPLLTTVPRLDTSNVKEMQYMFSGCSSLVTAPQLDTSKAFDLSMMFQDCKLLKAAPKLDTSSATNLSGMYQGCWSLSDVPAINVTSAQDMDGMFDGCTSLTSVILTGNPVNVRGTINIFNGVRTAGTLYYDKRYDFSAIIAKLPSTWTSKPIDVPN